MDIIDLEAIPTHDIISRLLEVPFFQDIQNFSLKQFNTILDHTKLVELDVGDVLLVHGQKNEYLYVLLEGRLDVFQDKPQENKALGKIVGAQIFGALGAINQEPRTATIAASRTEPAKILSINYGIFGDLDDFSHISLRTKVLLYTVVANNLRFNSSAYKGTGATSTLPTALSMSCHPNIEKTPWGNCRPSLFKPSD